MKALSLQQASDYLYHQYSKKTCDAIAKAASRQQEILHQLVDWVCGKDAVRAQRSSWSLGLLSDIDANLLIPYTAQLIAAIKSPNHNAVARNIIRVWQTMELPEAFHGEIFDICYQYLQNPHTAIAIRAFSATVCGRICVLYPELKPEILEMLPVWLEQAPPALKVRIRELEKRLK